jgi:hypothetical protein
LLHQLMIKIKLHQNLQLHHLIQVGGSYKWKTK